MLAISQHDNGWYEWEEMPLLCDDGYPMDFLAGPTAREKRELWQRSVDRAYAQHPYAGLIVAGHAAHLYRANLAHTPENEQAETEAFLQELDAMRERLAIRLPKDSPIRPALDDEQFDANVFLLKFGDNASLQVCVPWGEEGTLVHCPVDGAGEYVDITMRVSDETITFEPWPFSLDKFQVNVHGRLLEQSHFESELAYQTAMRSAPIHHLAWTVTRSG